MDKDLLNKIEEKYTALHHDPEVFLKGLLHSKPLTYWDYVEVDTLLSLQKTRTNFPDEYIFIVYHQVTELILTLIKHEIQQIVFAEDFNSKLMLEKIERCNRYTEVLITSFAVMSKGMDWEQYNQFRLALAPASGFQSAQMRELELYCTDLINLVKTEFKKLIHDDTPVEHVFDHVYWKDAGLNRQTGVKSMTLRLFEEKYLAKFIDTAKQCKSVNLEKRFQTLSHTDENYEELKKSLRMFDYLFNIKWPLTHLETAETYLIANGKKTAATGMSDWQKYLHPSYQRRKFFPEVWSAEEIIHWGTFEFK